MRQIRLLENTEHQPLLIKAQKSQQELREMGKDSSVFGQPNTDNIIYYFYQVT